MGDILDSLKVAIDMEKDGYELYMKAAGKTANKLGKSTLKAIAAKELDHIKAIEEFSGRIRTNIADLNKAISLINIKNKKEYLMPIIEKLRNDLDAKMAPDSDLEKAYEVAMRLEKESYDLYKKLAGETNDAQIKKFFEFLMGEENTHYELLQETLQYLNNPGDWFAEQERWIVEG